MITVPLGPVMKSSGRYFKSKDVPRKRRPPSVEAEAWAGTMIHTNMDQVCVKVTHTQWNKTRKMVHDIWQDFSDHQREVPSEVMGGDSAGALNHKQLEIRRGFLVYVTQSYPSGVPYLNRIHLTLDHWRSGRDEEGCK
jgi:hypothetical protein